MKTEEEKILDEIKRAKKDERPTDPIVVRKRKVVQPIVLPIARPDDEHIDLEDIHFCSECKNCRVVKRFNRTDRFCNLHLQVRQFFDHPAHREFDYDKSKLCCKINIDGKCTNFDVGGETEIPFKTRQNRP